MIESAYSIEDIIRYGIALILLASGILSIVYIIWGGLLTILSGGNEEKVKSAINYIRYAGIGLLVLFIIVFSAPPLFRIIGLPYGDSFRPGVLLSTIKELTQKIFTEGGESINLPQTTTQKSGLSPDFGKL